MVDPYKQSETMGHQDDGASGLSREPLRLSLSDILGIMFGFAVFFAIPFAFRFGSIGFVGAQLPLWFIALLGTLWSTQGLAFAISSVVVTRTAQYGRHPRPAEWLALLVSVWFLSVTLPPPDAFITRDFTVWRWIIGGLALVASIVVLLFAIRGTHATTIGTLLVCVAALILIWGPCAVLRLEFTDLFPWVKRLGKGWTFWLVLSALRFVAVVPLAMLFGIPVVATIQARRRDRFQKLVWTEWLSMLCVTVIGMTLLAFPLLNASEWHSISWMAEQIVGVLGLTSVAGLCWMILYRVERHRAGRRNAGQVGPKHWSNLLGTYKRHKATERGT